MSKQTKIALALVAAGVTAKADPLVDAIIQAQADSAPVALEGRDLFESVLSPAQADACEDFILEVCSHRADKRAFTIEAAAIVGRIFPKPVDKATWVIVAAGIVEATRETENDSYGRKVLAAAYKDLHGALPTAKAGKDGAVKPGSSPKKSARGLQSRVSAVVEYVETLDARDINASILAKVTAAVKAMAVAADAFAKAANE